jgi:2-polyprenyl-3-methyl-5-hydroxy-6-metoxy-1,4-benzoquinol methylase
LDLACGSGVLTEQFKRDSIQVIGLDSSERMIDLARVRTRSEPGLEFVRDDFRTFQLNRKFEAIVSSSNSLNYARNLTELSEIFQTVEQHLSDNGFFVFDTITEFGMKYSNEKYLHVDLGSSRFVIRSVYNPQTQRSVASVILPSGIETHHRIKIDKIDVSKATHETRLKIFESFHYPNFPSACFFVLTKAY